MTDPVIKKTAIANKQLIKSKTKTKLNSIIKFSLNINSILTIETLLQSLETNHILETHIKYIKQEELLTTKKSLILFFINKFY